MAQDPSPIWQFVRQDQYVRPKGPTTEVVRKGIIGLWQRLRGKPDQGEAKIAIADEELRYVPQDLLDRVAPEPRWEAPDAGICQALQSWMQSADAAAPVQVIISPPYSGVAQAVHCWATQEGWQIAQAPDPADLLADAPHFLNQLTENQQSPLAIAALEHWYLRHSEGLSTMHRLLDWLCSTPRRCLVHCDSWAWAFLGKAAQIDSLLPTPCLLQPLDHERLHRWFRSLAPGSDQEGFVFRQTDSGQHVLSPVDAGEGNNDGKGEAPQPPENSRTTTQVSDFFRHLAGYSRGIPGIAWTIWRYSLRFARDDEVNEEAQEEAMEEPGRTIWVKPWTQLKLPTLSSAAPQILVFVLHALLFHGRLHTQTLPDLMPFSNAEILWALQRLRDAQLVEQNQGVWRITALGYPAVRSALNSEGYLTDAL